MSENLAGRVGWSDKLIVIDGGMPLEAALLLIKGAPGWVVIRRGNKYLYAFRPEELLLWPLLRAALENPATDRSAPLERVLELHEEHQSTAVQSRDAIRPIDRSWRPAAQAPSIDRYVEVGPDSAPQAVGTIAFAGAPDRRFRGVPSRAKPPAPMAPPPAPTAAPPAPTTAPAAPTAAPAAPLSLALEDEGTSPVRHPSIDVDRALVAGSEIAVTVDLARHVVPHTEGGPISVGPLAADWQTLDVTVHLQCSALEFPNGSQAVVTMRRNADSIPATIKARVRADAASGPFAVMAAFMTGNRFCGSAMRLLDLGPTRAPDRRHDAVGTVVVEPEAEQPDVTVHISQLDKSRPGRLKWLIVTKRFDALPPMLEEDIDLDGDPAAQASALFRDFAVLERGQHTQRIEGFGSRLWTLAPPMFRTVYWALWDRYQRPLAIQFISDEPHMPWELMRPVRDDESEVHPPLALKHAVARWIKRWDGYMRNQVPPGRVCTIAPKYASASRGLKRAQLESEKLVAEFSAVSKEGTRASVFDLLQTFPPKVPIAVLHFAGHGKFAPEAATHSNIELEDGDLTAAEVERPEVKLGRACRTLVFFNACEVGAAGAVFGEVGGWADAFLSRQFGGFIAPLWSVDDEDAGVVAVDLLERIVRKGESIGAALRAVREAHGATSPTFYSYLYYGDVTARIKG